MRPACRQAEAALAPLEAGDGREEVVRGEVGPEAVEEGELGVGGAVEEEVGEAELAAGADDEVRVAHAQAGQAGAEERGVDGGRIERARGDLDGELARGGRDFFPAAVREGERQGHLAVA